LTSSTSSSERSGYSWKRLGLQFACVLVAFAALNVVVYYNNEYFEKARGYHELVDEATHRPNVRILFAGDSHLAHPLNAYLNDNPNATGFSVAFGGDSAREMFAKVRRVLESSKKVDTLALSVDPHMFGSGRIESSNRSFSDRYFLVDRDSSGLRQGWLSALLDQVPLFNNDLVQYLRKAIPASLTRRHSAAPRGDAAVSAEGEDTTWQSLSDAERAEEARKTGAMDHRGVGQEKQPFYWYGRMLDLARQRGITVIGVRFPVHSQYSAQVASADVARIDEFLRSRGVTKIVDLRDALSDPAYFDDPDHLNQRGAAKVLTLLAPQVDHLIFAGSPAE
jgi:hypothetical protein